MTMDATETPDTSLSVSTRLEWISSKCSNVFTCDVGAVVLAERGKRVWFAYRFMKDDAVVFVGSALTSAGARTLVQEHFLGADGADWIVRTLREMGRDARGLRKLQAAEVTMVQQIIALPVIVPGMAAFLN